MIHKILPVLLPAVLFSAPVPVFVVDGSGEMVFVQRGAELSGDTLELTESAKKVINFDKTDPAAFYAESRGWFYISRAGKMVSVVTFDNGPDPFSEGTARSAVNGRIGYIDSSLNFVIPPRFDAAFPFHEGTAKVGESCRTVKNGEYSEPQCERFYFIDRSGKELDSLSADWLRKVENITPSAKPAQPVLFH